MYLHSVSNSYSAVRGLSPLQRELNEPTSPRIITSKVRRTGIVNLKKLPTMPIRT